MHVRKGWAAFLALIILFLLSSSSALAGDGRPVIGCFTSGNALLLSRLPPGDPSVQAAFDLGGCLALPPDAPATAPVQSAGVWQLQILGSPMSFFAPSWGAPVGDRGPSGPLQGYAAFASQSGRLIQQGRVYAWCDRAEEDFARRWRDFYDRWVRYRKEGGRLYTDTTIVVRRHFTDHGPRLSREEDALQAERAALERKCAPVHDLVLDERFVDFLQSLP